MAQHDLIIDNQTFPAFRSDLNNGLQSLGTCMSGTSAPTTTYPCMLWADTTANQLKQRNTGNTAWVILGALNTNYLVTPANIGAATSADITSALSSSPALGGTPTAPTASAATNTTQIATTAFLWNNFTTATAGNGEVRNQLPRFRIAAHSLVITTNSSGNASVTYGTPFTSLITVVATNGDAIVVQTSPQVFSSTTSGFSVVIPGWLNSTYRLNYIAIGT
jgi:hypothetical protein